MGCGTVYSSTYSMGCGTVYSSTYNKYGMWYCVQEAGHETVMTLTIDRVLPTHFRTYTFVASNEIGTTEHKIELMQGTYVS